VLVAGKMDSLIELLSNAAFAHPFDDLVLPAHNKRIVLSRTETTYGTGLVLVLIGGGEEGVVAVISELEMIARS
jgi:hypothetical protein